MAVVSRATELNEKLGDGPQSFGALRGLYQILTGKAYYEGVLALCDRMDRVAQRDPDPYTLAEAIRLRGVAALVRRGPGPYSEKRPGRILAKAQRPYVDACQSRVLTDTVASEES